MPHPDAIAFDQYPDDVEPIAFRGLSVTVDPDLSGFGQLLLLPPVDRLHGLPELVTSPSFDLDEDDHAFAFHHEVDVSMPRSEPPLDHPPTCSPKPPLRDPLSEYSELLPGR